MAHIIPAFGSVPDFVAVRFIAIFLSCLSPMLSFFQEEINMDFNLAGLLSLGGFLLGLAFLLGGLRANRKLEVKCRLHDSSM